MCWPSSTDSKYYQKAIKAVPHCLICECDSTLEGHVSTVTSASAIPTHGDLCNTLYEASTIAGMSWSSESKIMSSSDSSFEGPATFSVYEGP